MARLDPKIWLKARADYETGMGQVAVARKYGVTHTAVKNRLVAENWTADFEDQIRAKVAAKLSGVVSDGDLKNTAIAIDKEAARRVIVSERHVKLSEQATALQQQAIGSQVDGKFRPDFEMQKSAKINSETVAILITLERKIHKLEDVDPPAAPIAIMFAKYDD